MLIVTNRQHLARRQGFLVDVFTTQDGKAAVAQHASPAA
jgi:hypothetical protein